jgi:ubiquinone/menaquinone biosynthesis C-methylase UbiE
MRKNRIVKDQFNKQAQNFSHWDITQNEKIHQSLFIFCGLQPGDVLLDAACGTGAFAIFAAKKIKEVKGVDISENMIEIAKKQAKKTGLKNIEFICDDVENLPCADETFTVVLSKSAFHHMKNYETVFKEMIRCCQKGGKICIEDIVAYDDKKLDDFFEELEKEIDLSHHLSLSKRAIFNLYKQNNIKVLRLFESTAELDLNDYINHAVQSKNSKQKINERLELALKDKEISPYLINKEKMLYWKRKVFTIVGQKEIK